MEAPLNNVADTDPFNLQLMFSVIARCHTIITEHVAQPGYASYIGQPGYASYLDQSEYASYNGEPKYYASHIGQPGYASYIGQHGMLVI